MHAYYIKRHDPLACPIPVTASWHAKKILAMGSIVRGHGGWGVFLGGSNAFSMKKAYGVLLGSVPHVPWKSLMSNSRASPKARFILWMCLHQRLATAERVARWLVEVDLACRICGLGVENQNHLFAQCPYVQRVWSLVFGRFARGVPCGNFADQVLLMTRLCRQRARGVRLIVTCWVELVYAIWMQRNSAAFLHRVTTVRVCADGIIFRAAARLGDTVIP